MGQTARDFVSLAAKEAGILGVGQSLLPEDINDCFTLLQRMLSQWQKRRWLVPMLIKLSQVGNNLESNRIGPGQYWNAPRPSEIKAAAVIQLRTNTNPVRIPLCRLFSYEDYLNKISLPSLNTLPNYYFYDSAYPYGNVFIWPIPSSIYEINLLVQGAIGFDTSISDGTIFTGGTGYVDGVYPVINLVNIDGTGTDATADITVAGGVVTVCTIHNGGNGYVINNYLTVNNSDLGGTGSGFSYNVTNVDGSLDNEFTMPPEYEEAIHYGLAIRICEMYGLQTPVSKVALAKSALNTIRKSNTQISELIMPPTLRKGRAFNIFNADGY